MKVKQTTITSNSDTANQDQWDLIIKPQTSLLEIPWRDIWRYRDLLKMFVTRDIVTVYKQTILGPIWFVIQPILTTAIYVLVFGNIAGISTDGMPKILFYLSGIIIWNYFAESFNQTAQTFKLNAHIFGKVYFPRLVLPLSKIVSSLIKFVIQFAFLLVVYFYFILSGNEVIQPNINLLLVPLYVIMMAGLGLGFGIVFTSWTTKYRDLTFLLTFGVQLLMYATPVIYPVSTIPGKYKPYILANPMTAIVEGFRYALLGTGNFSWLNLGYSFGFMVVLLFFGIIIFNKTEKSFIDTV
jgi:homopolymeric O-antigen transport system permease protein